MTRPRRDGQVEEGDPRSLRERTDTDGSSGVGAALAGAGKLPGRVTTERGRSPRSAAPPTSADAVASGTGYHRAAVRGRRRAGVFSWSCGTEGAGAAGGAAVGESQAAVTAAVTRDIALALLEVEAGCRSTAQLDGS